MPVIIPPDQFDLDPVVHDEKTLSGMPRPFASSDMTAYPIGALVNRPKNDVTASIELHPSQLDGTYCYCADILINKLRQVVNQKSARVKESALNDQL